MKITNKIIFGAIGLAISGLTFANTAQIERTSVQKPFTVTVNNQSYSEDISTSSNAADVGFPHYVPHSMMSKPSQVMQPEATGSNIIPYMNSLYNRGCYFIFDTHAESNGMGLTYITTVTAESKTGSAICTATGSNDDQAFHLTVNIQSYPGEAPLSKK